MHMRENGALCAKACDPVESLLQREMARMPFILQRVDDQYVEPGKPLDALYRKIADIRAVSDVTDPETQRMNVAMGLHMRMEPDRSAGAVDHDLVVKIVDQNRRHDRRIISAGRRFQAIAETLADTLHRQRIGIDRYPVLLQENVATQVIDAVQMVGMGMRVENGVDARHPGRNHLLTKIWPGIDSDDSAATIRSDLLDEKGRARAPVLGIFGIAIAPVTIQPRHTRR
ncbi:hypothetical protein D3C71_1109430 [compost metagenome]